MLGAIIGDIAGSKFEFNNHRNKRFKIFDGKSFFTDDTVMTCAVADILVNDAFNDKKSMIKILKFLGNCYPFAGYGNRFSNWIFSNDESPYNSFGNGAAMRISPVGWYAKSEEEVKKLSREITGLTHNHPEGIKGAEVTAMCVFKARNGASKEEIRKYVEQYYDLNFNYKELIKFYRFNETCQETVPQAIYCFLISNSFEDCLRTTISIGGDCDTTAAISCAIAEAFYGEVPESMRNEFLSFFNKKDKIALLQPIKKMYELCGKKDYLVL